MPFQVTTADLATGAMPSDQLAEIASAIDKHGYAVVTGLIPIPVCELLMASVLEDTERVRAIAQETPHEQRTGKGHLQLGLRRYTPYVRPELLANPLIEQVVSAVLGQHAWLGFYSGNVNLPGSTYQPVHYDRPFSWLTKDAAFADGQPWPPPTTTLSCSVALTPLTEDNGATEIFPGSHTETEVTKWPVGERVSEHPDMLERWGPPDRMVVPAGGVCFRDPRMWHRGVPNPSTQARPMIALTYHAKKCFHWRGRLVSNVTTEDKERLLSEPALKVLDDDTLGDGRLVFEDSARPIFEEHDNLYDINRNARFVSPPLKVNHFLENHALGGAQVVNKVEDVSP